jgi:hypothetical protein
VPIVRDKRFRKTLINSFEAHFGALTFVNPNTWHLIYNNFNLNFIFGIVCSFVCVCAFSLRRESPNMILGDKPLIFEVVLLQSRGTRAVVPKSERQTVNLSQRLSSSELRVNITRELCRSSHTSELYSWC